MQYLRNQSARVCWNNESGEVKFIDKGVRQGGILSPFLFKLYIDNMISHISSQEVGCRLGFLRMNIIAYADDLVILADSAKNLSYLYQTLKLKVSDLGLLLNENKSVCMVFKSNKCVNVREIDLGGDILQVMEDHKYLGYHISNTLSDVNDVKIRLNSFYSKFNSVIRNFSNVSVETLNFLFNSFCLPDYGLSLWNMKELKSKQIFKSFNIGYSNALKKMIGVPKYSSSHDAAEMCNQFLLKHHVALLQARFIKRSLLVQNEIFKLCNFYLKQGYLHNSIEGCFKEVYGVNIYDNQLDVLKSRIMWMQRHEPRREVNIFYNAAGRD